MLSLEQIRLHCRIDGAEEDSLLEQFRFGAFEVLKTHTGRNWYEAGEAIPEDDRDGIHLNAAANQAMLLLIGSWYAVRETDPSVHEIPAAFWHLIQPYRIYGV